MVDASIGVLVALSIIDFTMFYLALNFKFEELQVLFFGLGMGIMTVVFHVSGIVAGSDSLTDVQTICETLMKINTLLFYFVMVIFFIMLLQKVIKQFSGLLGKQNEINTG